DLLTDPARHRQHVTMTAGCELACLEPQDGAMVRAAAVAAEPRRLHAREVAPMRPAADADDVLSRRPSEPDHEVPALAGDRPRRGERERQEPREPSSADDRH